MNYYHRFICVFFWGKFAGQQDCRAATAINTSHATGYAEYYAQENYVKVPVQIVVTCHLDFSGETNIERSTVVIVNFTNRTAHDPSLLWKYFMGTNYIDVNYCCGPVEMQDKDKRKLPLLRPQINLPSAYPPSYSLTNAQAFIWRYRNRQAVALDGLLAPFPLLPRDGLEVDLPKFNIENYFKLETPGEYQLTVWPKIYQRSATNSDLCERIDLPPVTIPIQWTGGAKN